MFGQLVQNIVKKHENSMKHIVLHIFPLILITNIFSCIDKPIYTSKVSIYTDQNIQNYWNNFNFKDSDFCENFSNTEYYFDKFIKKIHISSEDSAQKAIKNMLSLCEKYNYSLSYFRELYDKYLYDPDSPYLNENLYSFVLQYILSSQYINESNKSIARFQLNMINKNQVGDIANDFIFIDPFGKLSSLSKKSAEYTVLFFNIPDCAECIRVKNVINNLSFSPQKIRILAIYPGKDEKIWNETDYPKEWINGYDIGESILSNNLYDLRAFPTIYLLDKNKHVLIKDATIEELESYFANTK